MLGELDAQQIEDVLRTEVIARLGCISDGRVYVVPVTYVYDGTYLYGHAMDGAKLRAMRANPQVCIEVEQVDDLSNWRSVIALGTFEECVGADWDAGFAMLAERIMPLLTLPANQPPPDLSVMRRGSVYRIRLAHKSGRFEEVKAD
jgi:nitroimidazol reductase NimA-like FMN-containing flavoprotein (pyridoxamine 5'-phosphate oxidase superfamily)